MTERFLDKKWGLHAYAHEVAVYCVHCKKPGMVKATRQAYRWNASFRCDHCALALDSDKDDWVGPATFSGRSPCGYCGYRWLNVNESFARSPSSPPRYLMKQCPQCSHHTSILVQCARQHVTTEGIDPHFGLPLRLTLDTRLGTLWVYNAQQLLDLRAYVSATLREGVTINGSYFSRLPTWIKQARHRGRVLAALIKLQKKYLSGK